MSKATNKIAMSPFPGSLTMRYLNGPTGALVDTVLGRESAGGTIAWYLPDRLATIRDLINNSGSIIDHVDYSAFGTVLDESSPSNGDRMMGFAGMERDTVTGVNLAVEREENPRTGRWDSQDPLGFTAGDADLYRYVGNSSTDATDQTGYFDDQDPPDIQFPPPSRPIGPVSPLPAPTSLFPPGVCLSDIVQWPSNPTNLPSPPDNWQRFFEDN